jgi:predicted translin family RNA/ssDNA-binding protein
MEERIEVERREIKRLCFVTDWLILSHGFDTKKREISRIHKQVKMCKKRIEGMKANQSNKIKVV